jgi:hypothetical protein
MHTATGRQLVNFGLPLIFIRMYARSARESCTSALKALAVHKNTKCPFGSGSWEADV